MNAAQLVDRAEQRYGDTTNSVVSAATWLDHINAAYRAFLRQAKWPTLVAETTAAIPANGRSVALPAAALQGGVIDVLVSGNPLEPQPPDLPLRNIRHWTDRPTSPLYYRVHGSRVFVLPAWSAGGTLTIAYLTAPTPLVAGGSPTTPIIPETYHDALVAGALALAYRDDDDAELAAHYQAEFDAMVLAARNAAPAPPPQEAA